MALTTVPPDDRVAAELRGFGPLGLLAIAAILFGNAVFVPLSALLVLAWARRSGTPWPALGFARPRSWMPAVALGLGLGVALKLVMKTIVMPLLDAEPINQTYHYLVGNTAALPAALYAVIVGAGFGEETVFRGFLFERFGRLFGPRAWAIPATLLITSVGFGLAHYADQGIAGVQQAVITGLVFGALFVATGRLWLPMFTHAAFDLTAVAIIYWDLETTLAWLFFRPGP